MTKILHVKADDQSIVPYGEKVQRRQAVFIPLDLPPVILGIGIRYVSVKILDNTAKICYNKCTLWGISAVGSASHWQCGGQGFESPMLHH